MSQQKKEHRGNKHLLSAGGVRGLRRGADPAQGAGRKEQLQLHKARRPRPYGKP